MKKASLNTKLKLEHRPERTVLRAIQKAASFEKSYEDDRIKRQFAQDALIYQQIKCRVAAMVCCLIHQV